ncbi:MAG: phosphodiester glycosidase family protein [Clostridia bacterium]|nr:phosphodiester glycosidase family protein [Clostridia bacterium]
MRTFFRFRRKLLSFLTVCALLAALFPFPVFFHTAGADWGASGFEVSENEPVWDETSYVSDHINIRISSQWYGHSDVYVCDIHIASTDCFRRAFGGDRWKTSSERIGTIAERNGAVLAITGDSGASLSSGMIVGNGEVLRDTVSPRRDLCVIYLNGVMRTFNSSEYDMAALQREFANDAGIWQVFLFGPALLDAEGHALKKFNSNVYPANPRSVIGYYGPGHYCFVQVDGRGVDSALEKGRRSTGLNLSELAAFMESLGCQAAYNLDGGQSSALWFNGRVISTPYNGGRRIGDIVCITDRPASDLAFLIR